MSRLKIIVVSDCNYLWFEKFELSEIKLLYQEPKSSHGIYIVVKSAGMFQLSQLCWYPHMKVFQVAPGYLLSTIGFATHP